MVVDWRKASSLYRCTYLIVAHWRKASSLYRCTYLIVADWRKASSLCRCTYLIVADWRKASSLYRCTYLSELTGVKHPVCIDVHISASCLRRVFGHALRGDIQAEIPRRPAVGKQAQCPELAYWDLLWSCRLHVRATGNAVHIGVTFSTR